MADKLTSTNGRFQAIMQDDGNFVLYDRGRPYYATGTFPPSSSNPSPDPAPPLPTMESYPRRGASYYTSLTDPRVNVTEWGMRLRDAGMTQTRLWLLDAWAVGQYGTGMYEGFVPWTRTVGGKFDLETVNPFYLERLRAYVESMNDNGILPELSGLELYTWSNRKQGLLWVPSADLQPFRHNVNGIHYADDDAFDVIGTTSGAHAFLGWFYRNVTTALQGLLFTVEIANEMPQKEMHYRLRDAWRAGGYTGTFSVNRNEDTPGQWDNMKIGREFNRLNFHGRSEISYLDEVFADEPKYQTFRAFFDRGSYTPAGVTISSDGCRKSTNPDDAYDYDALKVVFQDAIARGLSFEHQSRIKLRGFTEGRIDLADLETGWLRSL